MKKHERGEIATIITIGTLVVIGMTTIVSSFFINQKKTVGSQAAVTCDSQDWVCGGECASQAVRDVFGNDAAKWRAEAARNLGGSCSGNGIAPTIACEDGRYNNAGGCDAACCKNKSQCPNNQECNKSNGYCRSGTSCNPETGTTGGGAPPPGTGAGGGTGGSGAAGCFHLDAGVDKIGTNKFNVSIKFVSDGGDGDIQLKRDGAHVAGWNAWNKGAHGNVYTYGPEWTGGAIEVASGTKNVTYTGMVANSAVCPGVTASLTCSFSANGSYSCGGASAAPPAVPPAQPPAAPPVVSPKPQTPDPETSPIPSTTCNTTKQGIFLPRDGKTHCIVELGSKRYGQCITGQVSALELDCLGNKKCVNGQCVEESTICTTSKSLTISRDGNLHCISKDANEKGRGLCVYGEDKAREEISNMCTDGKICQEENNQGICVTPPPIPPIHCSDDKQKVVFSFTSFADCVAKLSAVMGLTSFEQCVAIRFADVVFKISEIPCPSGYVCEQSTSHPPYGVKCIPKTLAPKPAENTAPAAPSQNGGGGQLGVSACIQQGNVRIDCPKNYEVDCQNAGWIGKFSYRTTCGSAPNFQCIVNCKKAWQNTDEWIYCTGNERVDNPQEYCVLNQKQSLKVNAVFTDFSTFRSYQITPKKTYICILKSSSSALECKEVRNPNLNESQDIISETFQIDANEAYSKIRVELVDSNNNIYESWKDINLYAGIYGATNLPGEGFSIKTSLIKPSR